MAPLNGKTYRVGKDWKIDACGVVLGNGIVTDIICFQ